MVTKNQSVTKLEAQELKIRRSHVTAGTILLKPVLTFGGYSFNYLPDVILQHLLYVDISVNGSFEPRIRENNPSTISTQAISFFR